LNASAASPRLRLRVLAVDDLQENLFLLSRIVTRMGHEIVTARSGDQALEIFRERAPDVVLMDVMMPGMDGIETTSRIKAMQGRLWVPVIYITAANRDTEYLRGLDAGGDDFIAKPVSASMLQAKLSAVERVLALQRENLDQREALERYYHDAEEEQKVASHLMQRLVQVDNLRDDAVAYRLTPASHLSGDLVAAARTPGGVLHVLLADGTGHGLAASLGVMPVVQPFYAMTHKGFGLSTILQEVNRKVREWLPPGRFVAATLAAIDPREMVAQVWNGGNPPALLVADDGREVARFESAHLPLGILGPSDFDPTLERVRFDPGCELVACSDGIVEAQGAAATQFGYERLVATARAAPRGRRFERINAELETHLAGGLPHDDLSLVVVACDPLAEETRALDTRAPAASNVRTARWRFAIELGPEELRNLDVVPMLVGMVEQMANAPSHRGNLFVVFAELFNNALDHGVLMLDSRLKAEPEGLERYLKLRQRRLASLAEGSIEVAIELAPGPSGTRLTVRVCDSGDGFDPGAVGGDADNLNPFGRGIALVRRLCASVDYRGRGNEVVAAYDLAPAMAGTMRALAA